MKNGGNHSSRKIKEHQTNIKSTQKSFNSIFFWYRFFGGVFIQKKMFMFILMQEKLWEEKILFLFSVGEFDHMSIFFFYYWKSHSKYICCAISTPYTLGTKKPSRTLLVFPGHFVQEATHTHTPRRERERWRMRKEREGRESERGKERERERERERSKYGS